MTPLAGVVGICAIVTVGFLFLSARAITIWSGPRRGPNWALFFAQFDPDETLTPIPRRSGIGLAVLATAFESGMAYVAAHPAEATVAGSVAIAIQIGIAIAWTVYFFRLPKRTDSLSRPSAGADRARRGASRRTD
jgi:hypothetical protein